jgi:hypothetical protein
MINLIFLILGDPVLQFSDRSDSPLFLKKTEHKNNFSVSIIPKIEKTGRRILKAL